MMQSNNRSASRNSLESAYGEATAGDGNPHQQQGNVTSQPQQQRVDLPYRLV